MRILRIKIDGKIDELEIKDKKNISKLIESNAISKGISQFKILYEWVHEKKKILCYGWFDGDAGFENKHELIPNGISSFLEDESSEILLFGDIFIVCMEGGKYVDIDVSEYAEIFSYFCGGFDDCNTSDDSEEENEEEPNTDDENFIVNDSEEESSDETYSDEELDEDENEYD